MLCDAFCSHTALPRAKGVHQPRDSTVFSLKANNHSNSSKRRTTTPPPPPWRCTFQNTDRGRGKEKSSHRNMPGMKRAKGHELPPSAPCRILKNDDDSHTRMTWFGVDDASGTAERHDILGSFGGRPALGLCLEAGRSRARHGNNGRSPSGRSWSLAWSAPVPRENQSHCELRQTNRGAQSTDNKNWVTPAAKLSDARVRARAACCARTSGTRAKKGIGM